ncbi:MAG: radical SAM protein [Ginsengibacter sp.]
MQTLSASITETSILTSRQVTGKDVEAINGRQSPMIFGLHKALVKSCIWINILFLSFRYFKDPAKAFRACADLKRLRNEVRDKHNILKYAAANNKYYFTFNAPGWPSAAFDKYILTNFKKIDSSASGINLNTLIFGITKKCGYKCEHCFEWEALNKPETLNRDHLLMVIQSFQKAGITQVQLSGGEPLNRIDDIHFILKNIGRDTEVWLYTSGYHFTKQRSAALKSAGLAGIVISLDHWEPERHNIFRGKHNAFEWAKMAAQHATEQGLVVSLSLCATKDFISRENLSQYALLAKQWGVSFIQLLEPKAVGHYDGKDVSLPQQQVQLLEEFYVTYNYDKAYLSYPAIVYHGFYSRRVSCGGSANHYIYVDTDGDVHNCPFCQKKIFSALHDDIPSNLALMAKGGCKAFGNSNKNTV